MMFRVKAYEQEFVAILEILLIENGVVSEKYNI